MSSVKRSSLASSELGQLKAPGKWETSDITCDTMSSSSSVAKTQQTQQQSRDSPKSGNSTQEVTKVRDTKWLNVQIKIGHNQMIQYTMSSENGELLRNSYVYNIYKK